MSPASRNGSLDVLRAAAILAVLACHTANAVLPDGDILRTYLGVGGRGVDLFFVLSGFLLGQQLFKELTATGTVAVRRFWLRRWLRTLPAYYACLLALFAAYVAVGKADKIDLRYVVFLQNYLPEAERPYFGVTWSLCVEEHFYLLVAPAVWLAARSDKWAAIALGVVAGFAGLHALGYYAPQDAHGYTQVSQVWFLPCFVGVMIGWLKVRRPAAFSRMTAVSPAIAVVGLVSVAVAAENRTHWTLPDWTLGGWAAIFASWVVLANRGPFWSKRMSFGPTRFVAVRAYSIYLVHEFVLTAVREKLNAATELKAAAAVGLTFVAAEVLYRCVERPALTWRDKHR